MVRLALAVLLLNQFEVVRDCGGALAPPVNDAPATQLSAGDGSACSVDQGVVRCWGENLEGQLGRGTRSAREPSGLVSLPEQAAQVAVGASMACARSVTGRVWCWGLNDVQQLGVESTATPRSSTPLEVTVPVPVKKLALHSDYVLALGSDGRLFGWGNDSEGTLGRGDENPMRWPAPVGVLRAAPSHRFQDVSAGQGHACGLELDGSLWCWGRNTEQQLGAGAMEQQVRSPVHVMDGVSAVAVGAFSVCALSGGTPWCWGSMPLDNGSTDFVSALPKQMSLGGPSARAVDVKWFHACVVSSDDSLFCFGRGLEGQLGLNDDTLRTAFTRVSDGVKEVATGFFFTCARLSDGRVACAGENAAGQLGLGDTARRSVLTPQ